MRKNLLLLAIVIISACKISDENNVNLTNEDIIELAKKTPKFSQSVPDHVQSQMAEFKSFVRTNDIESIASLIKHFPIKRPNNLLHNKEEFIKYYPHIFDDSLKTMIAEMQHTDEDLVLRNGNYGILLGKIWFNEDGEILIINYNSQKEAEDKATIKNAIEARDHASLEGWSHSLVRFETEKFFIHLYYFDDKSYTYASWSKPKATSEKPNMILNHGTEEFQGTMGGVIYRFDKAQYTYEVEEINMAEDDIEGWYLRVYNDNQKILEQKAIRIYE